MQRRSPTPEPLSGPFSFSYEDFIAWYSDLTATSLEPARLTFVRILNETLDQELSDVDRLRIRVSHSRVKSPPRLWNKMLTERYVDRIGGLADIPNVIDDLVGVRVTCNNLVDVENFRNIVVSLSPLDEAEMTAGLCIDPDTERRHAKDSGYRAYHINLHTLIPGRDDWKPARGELQVRTLLQDSWGELTHEDTYKPGSHMPALITKLAKRMADLLATVDDLAQDLRSELDQLAQSDVADGRRPEQALEAADDAADVEQTDASRRNIGEALLSETRRVVEELTKPASLAQVAWQVQANFGREVTVDWGGFGSFKDLLRAAVPGVHIIDVPPGTVVPAGAAFSPNGDGSDQTDAPDSISSSLPRIVARLKQHDSGIPAISVERLSVLLHCVTAALGADVWETLSLSPNNIGTRELNQLAKHARSLANDSDTTPTRAHLDYVLKSLYFSQNLRPGLHLATVATILLDWFFARASRLGLVEDPESDRQELEEWLSSAVSQ